MRKMRGGGNLMRCKYHLMCGNVNMQSSLSRACATFGKDSALCIRVSAHFNFAHIANPSCRACVPCVNSGIWQAKDQRLVRHGISIKINSRIPYIACHRGLDGGCRTRWVESQPAPAPRSMPAPASCGFFTQLHSGVRLAGDAL